MIFRVPGSQAGFADRLAGRGVLVNAVEEHFIRALTHLDLTDEDIAVALEIVEEAL